MGWLTARAFLFELKFFGICDIDHAATKWLVFRSFVQLYYLQFSIKYFFFEKLKEVAKAYLFPVH